MGKIIGKFVKGRREQLGLSQGDVAKKLKLKTPQSLSNIERGISPLPANKIKPIAALLKVTPLKMIDLIIMEKRAAYKRIVGLR